MKPHNKQWFINRIGKRIYRHNGFTCKCDECKTIKQEGLVIRDEQHAGYIYDCQNDMQLIYSDKQIERSNNDG